ncbi:MAG: exodeoxyribonuclease VII small subunit [Acidimicrobiales bacterium]|jgi:exodeoxyribonuclease VII small subunit|nr:exodeoxyribonuclease VII small subunit [Acidimicrobiales bacterium]
MPAEATADGDHDDLAYADAVAELEEILTELDRDDVDVDRLAEQVQRAASLITLCRSRLQAARVEVTRIVADLDTLDTGDTPDGPVPSAVDAASPDGPGATP